MCRLPYVLPVLMQVFPVQCGFAGLQLHVSVCVSVCVYQDKSAKPVQSWCIFIQAGAAHTTDFAQYSYLWGEYLCTAKYLYCVTFIAAFIIDSSFIFHSLLYYYY